MSDFLLELLSEEIPARMQAKARGDLARMFAEVLAAAGLLHEGITTYSTPRRLALIAKGLPAATEAVSEEVKGPRTSVPSQALDGFLRKTGLTQDQLQDRDGIWFATIDKPGRAAAEVLAEAVAAIVRDFPWPKSMRWGDASASPSSLRWVRPLHSIVALLGEAIVPVAIDGVSCGAATLGHRFHHPGTITIGGAHDYVQKLRACHVLVDHSEREAIVRKGAIEAAEKAGFSLVEDEGLVVENAGMTEWPVPLLGSFDADYLDVPEEVIQLTARINQKYFVMRDGEGHLAPHFVCVANIDANDGGLGVVAGNERVLAARLSDARFFWQQDVKVPLEEQAKKLEQIVFHEKLGTVADKVERVAKLARWLVEEGIVTSPLPQAGGAGGGPVPSTNDMPSPNPSRLREGDLATLAERAALLAKADLVTGMVGEFPELQGIIGGYLARAQGEPDAVADAIRDHYKPVGQGDDVPTAPVTVAVSLADKLDTLVGFFQFGEKPTGSKDPFALRRAALGILSLIIDNNIRASMFDLITAAAHEGGADAGRDLAIFLIERLKVQQREAGIRHDMIDAVVAVETSGDNVRMVYRVHALQAFVATGEGANLLAGYKRAANILKKEEWDAGAAGTGDIEPAEAALADALAVAEPQAAAAIEAERFGDAMSALASLRAPIDAFFENVTVNATDAGVRARRLNLLARFRDAVHRVADFSKIEG
ncbi:MAG: glycine--tRNA ligase subunit beta [Sphingomicrobium sp.]